MQEEETLNVELREADYLNDLISKNKYLSNKVEELKKNNLRVDTTVRTIKGLILYTIQNLTILLLVYSVT